MNRDTRRSYLDVPSHLDARNCDIRLKKMKSAAAVHTSDMNREVMFDGMLSDGEREKMRKIKEDAAELLNLAETRIITRAKSLEDSNKRLCAARARKEEAKKAYDEAQINLAPDDDDDYATEIDKLLKFDVIEAEYLIGAEREYQDALMRAGWELREAKRAGLSGK